MARRTLYGQLSSIVPIQARLRGLRSLSSMLGRSHPRSHGRYVNSRASKNFHLAAGETQHVSLKLNRRSFSYFDVATKSWKATRALIGIQARRLINRPATRDSGGRWTERKAHLFQFRPWLSISLRGPFSRGTPSPLPGDNSFLLMVYGLSWSVKYS